MLATPKLPTIIGFTDVTYGLDRIRKLVNESFHTSGLMIYAYQVSSTGCAPRRATRSTPASQHIRIEKDGCQVSEPDDAPVQEKVAFALNVR